MIGVSFSCSNSALDQHLNDRGFGNAKDDLLNRPKLS